MLPESIRKIPVAITIAGSDSGGGAGIQADLKSFAAMGVHGTVAITAVTAQNTYEVTGVYALPPEFVVKQIETVYRDMGIDAGKTGMLFSSEIISAVADIVRQLSFPLVVDPVMIAKSGAPLLRDDAVDALINRLIPIATVVTPNRFEAEKIIGESIYGVSKLEEAAKKISKLGVEAVLVKGGHLDTESSIDILYYNGKVYRFESPRYSVKTTHGTGCALSAAIAAGLARGLSIVEAVSKAKDLISDAIRFGLYIGRGHGPVNPMAPIYREASKIGVRDELMKFIKWLKKLEGVDKLVPEVGMNIAYASLYARDRNDFVAIPGRIRRLPTNGIAVATPEFGGSDHLARYLLTIQERFPDIRVAINIRYVPNVIEVMKRKGYRIASYDRSREPKDIKSKEGGTISWGVRVAIKDLAKYPHLIYHLGDVGKEPMIVLFGRSLDDVRNMILDILEVVR